MYLCVDSVHDVWFHQSQRHVIYAEVHQSTVNSSSEPEELEKVAKSSQLSLVCVSEPTVIEPESHQQSKTTPMGKSRVSVLDISPYPHAIRNSSIKRRAECSCILTSTPVKRALEEKRSTSWPTKAQNWSGTPPHRRTKHNHFFLEDIYM